MGAMSVLKILHAGTRSIIRNIGRAGDKTTVADAGAAGYGNSAVRSTPMSDPPLHRLGNTDLHVTNLCVGCAELGNMPETFEYTVPETQALETLRACFRGPINFLDTAPAYGDGESERRIGIVLRELGGVPQGFVLATKADRDLHTGDFSGDQIQRSVEGSLKRLGLDRLQMVYLHDPEHTAFANIMGKGGATEVLLRYKEQGVIAHLGMAGGPIDLMIRYIETGAFAAVITHNRYTLLNRSAEPLLARATELGIAVVNAAPYGSGLLVKGPDAYPRYAYQAAPPELLDRARRLAAVCAKYNVPLPAAALQFSLSDRRITSTIVGFTKVERIAQSMALARHPIPDAAWPELDAIGYDTSDPEANRWK
jgi:D-threo-aldose 1-dehydrogenase